MQFVDRLTNGMCYVYPAATRTVAAKIHETAQRKK
jgi:hypothetical protein